MDSKAGWTIEAAAQYDCRQDSLVPGEDPHVKLPSKPETVSVSDRNHNSVTLKVSPPRFGAEDITSYSVEYCVSGQDGWKQKKASKAEEVTVSGLSLNTEYMFRVRCDCGEAGRSKESFSVNVRTKKPLTESLKTTSTRVNSASPSVYSLSLTEEDMDINGCRRFSFGKESTRQNRTIMLFGVTGSGKSTLINAMINYIVGVEWEDDFRFKLVDEDESKSPAEGQTSEVTVYKINHQEGFKIDHSLTIVDTPGFGGAGGGDGDRKIIDHLCDLFSADLGVSEIDAVCFVAPAALAELPSSQRYVIDSVLSIFGKDVLENIRVLVTSTDGQQPPVLQAIKASGVPCPKTKDGLPIHFKFNNSALFADNKSSAEGNMSDDDEDGSFDQMFWNLGRKSTKRFFDALNVMETKSLTMTKASLRHMQGSRQLLESSVTDLQELVKVLFAKLEEIRETSEILKKHEVEINRKGNYEFEVAFIKPVQVEVSGSESHEYRWNYEEVKEKKTVRKLKDEYLESLEAKIPVQALIERLKAEDNHLQAVLEKLIDRSAKCLNNLKNRTLKLNPLSTPEYIDMLIEEETSESHLGWELRVQYLKAMQRKLTEE